MLADGGGLRIMNIHASDCDGADAGDWVTEGVGGAGKDIFEAVFAGSVLISVLGERHGDRGGDGVERADWEHDGVEDGGVGECDIDVDGFCDGDRGVFWVLPGDARLLGWIRLKRWRE